jgi:hypothetical protein
MFVISNPPTFDRDELQISEELFRSKLLMEMKPMLENMPAVQRDSISP